MTEWVRAINAARSVLDELPANVPAERLSYAVAAGDDGDDDGGAEVSAAVRKWLAAEARGESDGALSGEVAQRIAEEFEPATAAGRHDVESVIEVADRCAELMCGVLDDVRSFEGLSPAQLGGGASAMFDFYLRSYHGNIFAHLGGFFLDADQLTPPDAVALFAWVQGYHSQLARLGLDASSLVPSLADAAADLIDSSAVAFASELDAAPDADAFEPQLAIARTKSGSGKASMSRSSAHESTLELPVYTRVVEYLHAAADSLQPKPLSELLCCLFRHLAPALASMHARLLAVCTSVTAASGAGLSDGELLEGLHSDGKPLSAQALEEVTALAAEAEAQLGALVTMAVQHVVGAAPVADAAHAAKLFPPEWWVDGPSSGGGVESLTTAVAAQLRMFTAATVPAIVPTVDRSSRAAATRLYLGQLLAGSSGKLNAIAADSLSRDTAVFGAWCTEGASEVSNLVSTARHAAPWAGAAWAGDGGLALALDALDCTRRLMIADEAAFVDIWSQVLKQHSDAPLAVAAAVITRRPDLSRAKKALTSKCQQAHAAAHTEALRGWAGGTGARPGTAGAFSAAVGAGAKPRAVASSRWPFS
jgi:hypothetical protein